MRDPERIKRILDELEEFWQEVPDWRLGQLISNIVGNDAFIFHIEDDDFEARLQAWLRDTRGHSERKNKNAKM